MVRSLGRGVRLVPLDFDRRRPAARLRDVEGVLHWHQRLDIDSEGLLETQGHLAAEVCLRI